MLNVEQGIRAYSRKEYEEEVTDNLVDLLAVLPPHLVESLANADNRDLIELVLDLGRKPEARYAEGELVLVEEDVTRADLEFVARRIGHFGEDNRAGIERTLHRISAIRNRGGQIVGLTCRIGRAVYGTIAIIQDLVESGQSILILGRPGVGKTTLLRETARVLADSLRKRVVVVDTSNEIAGDGDIPHPAIGRARRMQVPSPSKQHAVMIEAVENHMPQVIVIDEIGTELEAHAARTIAERGVQLVGTAHGNSLENLMLNPTLADLIGGIQSVTLSDEEARRRGTQKSVLERKAPPTFTVLVEIQDRDRVAIHHDVAAAVDALLRGQPLTVEVRRRLNDGTIETGHAPVDDGFSTNGRRRDERGNGSTSRRSPRNGAGMPAALPVRLAGPPPLGNIGFHSGATNEDSDPLTRGRDARKPLRVYPFGVSRNRLEQVLRGLAVPAIITRDLRDGDMVMTLKNYYRRRPPQLVEAEELGKPVYVLRSNTATQMEIVLASLFGEPASERLIEAPALPAEDDDVSPDDLTMALEEAETAVSSVIDSARPVELSPQAAYVRRLQHQIAERYNLNSRSRGKEPYRRVEILPGGRR